MCGFVAGHIEVRTRDDLRAMRLWENRELPRPEAEVQVHSRAVPSSPGPLGSRFGEQHTHRAHETWMTSMLRTLTRKLAIMVRRSRESERRTLTSREAQEVNFYQFNRRTVGYFHARLGHTMVRIRDTPHFAIRSTFSRRDGLSRILMMKASTRADMDDLSLPKAAREESIRAGMSHAFGRRCRNQGMIRLYAASGQGFTPCPNPSPLPRSRATRS